MGESSQHGNHLQVPSSASRLVGVRNAGGGGEIVEVEGGHIIRSTGRKDRHSKVCTAKGPRDRRVRLAAHTAIQFYDVQDRLGYDRPSKAVDWLMKKAKAAIDDLAELPAWKPTSAIFSAAKTGFEEEEEEEARKQVREEQEQHGFHQADLITTDFSGPSSKRAISMLESDDNVCRDVQNASFLPPSLDTSMSFFPMGASAETSSSSMQFPSFPAPEFLSRISTHSQDLRLSLQSVHDTILLGHPQGRQHQNPTHQAHSQAQVFLGGTALSFDAWQDHHLQAAELTQSPSLRALNPGGDSVSWRGGAAAAAAAAPGYTFITPPGSQQLLGQHQFFSQRGTLQSRDTSSTRAWNDPSVIPSPDADQSTQPQLQHLAIRPVYPSSMSSIGFASGVGGFQEFHIPARIQGNQENQVGYSSNPSSDSRHQV